MQAHIVEFQQIGIRLAALAQGIQAPEETLSRKVLAEEAKLQRLAHPLDSTRPLGSKHGLVHEGRQGILGVLYRGSGDLPLEGHVLQGVETGQHLLSQIGGEPRGVPAPAQRHRDGQQFGTAFEQRVDGRQTGHVYSSMLSRSMEALAKARGTSRARL